jgi:hypothetical protein
MRSLEYVLKDFTLFIELFLEPLVFFLELLDRAFQLVKLLSVGWVCYYL